MAKMSKTSERYDPYSTAADAAWRLCAMLNHESLEAPTDLANLPSFWGVIWVQCWHTQARVCVLVQMPRMYAHGSSGWLPWGDKLWHLSQSSHRFTCRLSRVLTAVGCHICHMLQARLVLWFYSFVNTMTTTHYVTYLAQNEEVLLLPLACL